MKDKIIKILKSHSYHHTEGVGVKSQFKYLAEIAFECCADEIMLALDQSQFTADEAEDYINQEVEKRIAEKMPSEEEWIDIKDRMPESGQCVLIYSHSGGVAEGAWLSSKNHFEQWRWSAVLNDVTHWFIDVFLNNSEKYHNKIDKK